MSDAWIDEQLVSRGITDARVLDAMRRVPRNAFVPADSQDAAYAEKAATIGSLARDPIEIVVSAGERLAAQVPRADIAMTKLAFHSPCTLQHGLKIRGKVEPILQALGFELTPVADSHLCCGSAGTYSVLQPELATALKVNKLRALEAGHPAQIATANIGCLTHLASGTRTPVRHWIEIVDERLPAHA